MRFTLVITIILLAGTASGQEPVTVKQISTLATDLEYGSSEILEWLQGEDIVLDVQREDLEILRKLEGLDDVVAFLELRLAEKPAALTVDDVIAMWKEELGEEAIRKKIVATETRLALSIADALALKRAGVPAGIIRFLRTPRKAPGAQPADTPLTPEEIVKRTALGASPEEIIALVVKTDSRFQLTTADLVQLHRDGVHRKVLREIYARNEAKKMPAPAVGMPEGGKMTPVATPMAARDSLDPIRDLEIFRDDRAGYELLIPKRFVATKEYRGRKALLQLIDRMPEGHQGLPDLELSILMVHPKQGERGKLTPERLPAMARTLVDDLKKRFGADRIDVRAGEPSMMWIGGRRAVRVETTSTAASGKSYVGASTILLNDDRIYVLSFSVRLEQSELWRGMLEKCVDSFGFGAGPQGATAGPAIEGATDRARLENVFNTWRSSLQKLDFVTWRGIHRSLEDGVKARLAFLEESGRLTRTDQRVELSRIDTESGSIAYSTFGLDGAHPHSLSVAKTPGGWRLVASD